MMSLQVGGGGEYNEYAPLSKAIEEDKIYSSATLGWKTNARTGRLMTFGFICFYSDVLGWASSKSIAFL
jgi:hypothetical protein